MFINTAKAIMVWLDKRFPLISFCEEHLTKYYAPKNFNFLYFFGSLALLILVNQIVTGVFLAMYFKPDAKLAFDSVEYIMRDISWGWLIRYMHSTGASTFFVIIYLHMFRALFYGSYKTPRELVWLFGMLIFVLLMAEAFMGYLLPWGQMSYWGAQVIISLFGAIPGVGEDLALWISGDYVVADATLNRFFALHVIAIPLGLLGLVLFHLVALHTVGSNNPDGIEIKANCDENGIPLDGIPFHPYYTIKDLFVSSVFLIVFALIVFYMPEMGGYFLEHPNFEPANPMKTPEHIAPVWYFTPFYSILRAVPDKLGGVIAMGAAISVLFALPWFDRCPVRSIRYRGDIYKVSLLMFVICFVGLGILGTMPVTEVATNFARLFAIGYFGYFLALPLYSGSEKVRSIPTHLTAPIIPLSQRDGLFWRLVKNIGIWVSRSPFWQSVSVSASSIWQKFQNSLKFF